MKIKIVSIVGTRPQLIKVAEMDKAINENTEDIIHIIIHTGQHFDHDMSGSFFDELEIPQPDVFLNINSGTHGQNTGAMIPLIEKYLDQFNPSIVLVYGDCDSTLAGTIAAKKMNIPVAHIEAGVRSFDRKMPEEQNRVMVDSIADLLFTPTQNASHILDKELNSIRIHNSGDLMYDSFRRYEHKIKRMTPFLNVKYYFATIHRKENADSKENLETILKAFEDIEDTVVFSVHPRTLKKIKEFGLELPGNVRTIPPQPYLQTLNIINTARAVLTDSGGIQKEAFWLQTPCVTIRNTTEWPETKENNWNILTGADRDRIKLAVQTHNSLRKDPSRSVFLYGSGVSGKKVLNVVKQYLTEIGA